MGLRLAFAAAAVLAAACRPAQERPARCPASVDDGIACTADACDEATGAVSHVADDGACPSGQICHAASGCGPPGAGCESRPVAAGTAYRLEIVASGLEQPVHAVAPAGDAERIFVAEQRGRVRVVRGGLVAATPFVDLSAQVSAGGERGLLGVAFHPDFASNGKLYVHFTDLGGDVRVAELTAADPGGDTADPASLVDLVTVEHSTFANHNGGGLAFGPDGRLYVGVGDGGGSGDPSGSGQSKTSLLGKLLRLDVAAPSVPVAGNPFGNAVYHLGLRNPWRFSFDRTTGDLYVGDVGQDAWEEIDYQAAAGAGQPPFPGTNWGWSVMEGNHCFSPAAGCDTAGLALPVAEYSHAEGASVIGGFVYRGRSLPDLAATGTYFYGDFATGFVRTLRVAGGVVLEAGDATAALGGPFPGLASFAEDGCGELLLVTLDGTIRRLVAAP